MFWLVDSKELRLTHHFFQSCHGKGPSDSEGAVVKSGLRAAEFIHGEYLAGTEEAYKWLVENRSVADKTDDPGYRARKLRHTIARRTFHLVPFDEVNHCKAVITALDDMKSHFYFDGVKGARQNGSTLVYGELSHFCAGCFAGTLVDGNLECDGEKSMYHIHEMYIERESGCGISSQRTEATKMKVKRAEELLQSGKNGPAKAGDWVLAFVSDLHGCYDRDQQLQGEVVPVQLIDPLPVTGKDTISKTHSPRKFLRIHEWCEVVERERM